MTWLHNGQKSNITDTFSISTENINCIYNYKFKYDYNMIQILNMTGKLARPLLIYHIDRDVNVRWVFFLVTIFKKEKKGLADVTNSQKKSISICMHDIIYLLGYSCAHAATILIEDELGFHSTTEYEVLIIYQPLEQSNRAAATLDVCLFKTNITHNYRI
jgi:hypothetical protein